MANMRGVTSSRWEGIEEWVTPVTIPSNPVPDLF